ncbi:penicillin-binding transpeptidase domain-containing protein [Clostridioides sp. ES-W-0016-02]|uniref:penicillin-binding transpeptidase domain-containing protein n=1 Tax=Clostridioides sp. ES-W-0016-02 TaxID=2770788 RepID=UPI001D11DD2E|nr:class D beta-lactamase [Clostridioides sp. ES-W-0016-02]
MKRKTSFILIIILLIIAFIAKHSMESNQKSKEQNIKSNNTNFKSNELDSKDSTQQKKDKVNVVDYSDCFKDISGGAVFYSSKNKEYNIYNKELIETRASPCSTFKIISTLIGLEKGIVNSKESVMGYNGTIYEIEDWNRNLNLEEAFKVSCVWYHRKLMNQVDAKFVQNTLDNLKYGNCDISEWEGNLKNGSKDLNGFWLESSLKISPKEQTQVLTKIFEGDTSFKKENINLLKDIMKIDTNDKKINVYGKTGTGFDEKKQCVDAWFVGMVENEDDTYYFAIKSDDSNKKIGGPKVKEIAIDIINNYYSTI